MDYTKINHSLIPSSDLQDIMIASLNEKQIPEKILDWIEKYNRVLTSAYKYLIFKKSDVSGYRSDVEVYPAMRILPNRFYVDLTFKVPDGIMYFPTPLQKRQIIDDLNGDIYEFQHEYRVPELRKGESRSEYYKRKIAERKEEITNLEDNTSFHLKDELTIDTEILESSDKTYLNLHISGFDSMVSVINPRTLKLSY